MNLLAMAEDPGIDSQAFRDTLEGLGGEIKDNLEGAMITTGKTKFKTDLFCFGIQKNPATVVINNEEKVPPQFLKVTTTVNKTAIKDALYAIKSKEEVAFNAPGQSKNSSSSTSSTLSVAQMMEAINFAFQKYSIILFVRYCSDPSLTHNPND